MAKLFQQNKIKTPQRLMSQLLIAVFALTGSTLQETLTR